MLNPSKGKTTEKKQKEGLKNQASEGGEGVVATEVALGVEAVKFFEPLGWLGEEIAQAGEVVGEHGAEGAGQKQGEWNGVESRGPKKDEKNSPGNDLIGNGEGKEAGEFCFAVGGGVDPVAEA